jgi:hypothetical protein
VVETLLVKALTLTQPWATLVIDGPKRIETRSWSTKYRGPLAIHAAASTPGGRRGLRSVCDQQPFAGVLGDIFALRVPVGVYVAAHPIFVVDHLPMGALLGYVDLVDVRPTDPQAEDGVRFTDIWGDDEEEVARLTEAGWWMDGGIPVAHWPQKAWGDFTPGRFAWFLEDPRPVNEFGPVPMRGAQGLWNLDAAKIEEACIAMIEKAAG